MPTLPDKSAKLELADSKIDKSAKLELAGSKIADIVRRLEDELEPAPLVLGQQSDHLIWVFEEELIRAARDGKLNFISTAGIQVFSDIRNCLVWALARTASDSTYQPNNYAILSLEQRKYVDESTRKIESKIARLPREDQDGFCRILRDLAIFLRRSLGFGPEPVSCGELLSAVIAVRTITANFKPDNRSDLFEYFTDFIKGGLGLSDFGDYLTAQPKFRKLLLPLSESEQNQLFEQIAFLSQIMAGLSDYEVDTVCGLLRQFFVIAKYLGITDVQELRELVSLSYQFVSYNLWADQVRIEQKQGMVTGNLVNEFCDREEALRPVPTKNDCADSELSSLYLWRFSPWNRIP